MPRVNRAVLCLVIEVFADAIVDGGFKFGYQRLVDGPDFTIWAKKIKKRTVPNWPNYCT